MAHVIHGYLNVILEVCHRGPELIYYYTPFILKTEYFCVCHMAIIKGL